MKITKTLLYKSGYLWVTNSDSLRYKYKHTYITTSWFMRLVTIIQHLLDVTTDHVPYLRPRQLIKHLF